MFGDGEQTRDFVNVADVAQANLQAAHARKVTGAFNIGSGTRVTVNELVRLIEGASGIRPSIRYAPPRDGDVRDSMADISAARSALEFEPAVGLAGGLAEYLSWARQESSV